MSGKFNQQQNAPAANGWHIFTPQHSGGKYDAYQNQLVIIVTETRKRKPGPVYLTKKVMEALKQPKFITMMARGQVIGFMSSETNEGAYVVARKEGTESASLNIVAFLKSYSISPGVYIAHLEEGVLTVDTQQNPSRLP